LVFEEEYYKKLKLLLIDGPGDNPFPDYFSLLSRKTVFIEAPAGE